MKRIADSLRATNLPEYIIYMYGIEDTLRANGFSLARLKQVLHIEGEDVDWYGDVIMMMNNEGTRERGHISLLREATDALQKRHDKLIQDDTNRQYTEQYYRALPYIVEVRGKGMDKSASEIETCLTVLYGVMVMRMQRKEISHNTQNAVGCIARLLALLNQDMHKQ